MMNKINMHVDSELHRDLVELYYRLSHSVIFSRELCFMQTYKLNVKQPRLGHKETHQPFFLETIVLLGLLPWYDHSVALPVHCNRL